VTVEVVKPGLLSTLQDLGRFGYQRFGVVAGGVMDEWSHRIANALVGNAPDEATLECTLLGPSLRFDDAAVIAICGADLSPRIGDEALPQETPIRVAPGTRLDFGPRKAGCRAYLAIGGGYRVAPVMGSRSTFLRGAFGGFHGRALRSGDMLDAGGCDERTLSPPFRSLPCGADVLAAPPATSAHPMARAAADCSLVRVIAGSQWAMFTEEARRDFLAAEFRVSPQSDRMGYRLEGPALALKASLEMISEAVGFGTIQVPPDGRPIVLMADRQTTGGYPKLASVASVDLPLLAQMPPQHRLRFALVSLDEAQALYLAREREFRRFASALDRPPAEGR
jgi:urea carboxylase